MKPYKERLPLIDAAIDFWKGKYLPVAIFVIEFDLTNGEWTAQGFSEGYLFNRGEFLRRKVERQNKPKWVNAPDWATCLKQDEKGLWTWHEVNPALGYLTRGGYYRVMTAGEGEVIGDWRDTLEKRPIPQYATEEAMLAHHDGIGQWPRHSVSATVEDIKRRKEKDMNDWYSKGVRPPIGTKCEAEVNGAWHVTEVVGYNKTNGNVVFTASDITGHIYDGMHPKHFRPLRTETDKLVEQMIVDATGSGFSNRDNTGGFISEVIEKLVDKGYRKIEPMSEDEFVTQAQKELTDFIGRNQLVKLHRAGCVFLDKGDDHERS